VTVVKDGKTALKKVGQTSSLKERSERARQFVDAMKVTVPTLVDRADDQVNTAYSGWPERLYVVGVDGRIAYKGGPGPGGFRVAEVEKWLRENRK
jgi:type I thyroxine 5'-deiodinase